MEEQIEPVKTLKDHVREAIDRYFNRSEGWRIHNLYDLVWDEVEGVLIEATMKHTKNSQVKAAVVLGISRGTLRKLLKKHGFLKNKASIL